MTEAFEIYQKKSIFDDGKTIFNHVLTSQNRFYCVFGGCLFLKRPCFFNPFKNPLLPYMQSLMDLSLPLICTFGFPLPGDNSGTWIGVAGESLQFASGFFRSGPRQRARVTLLLHVYGNRESFTGYPLVEKLPGGRRFPQESNYLCLVL